MGGIATGGARGGDKGAGDNTMLGARIIPTTPATGPQRAVAHRQIRAL